MLRNFILYLKIAYNITNNLTKISVGSKDAWWYPKPKNQKGKIWITDGMPQEDLDVVGVIANLCLIECCIGTF